MSEPLFIRQTAEPITPHEQRKWFSDRSDEAKAEGATFARYSIHPRDARIILIEAWKVRPQDQGEPRFSVTY